MPKKGRLRLTFGAIAIVIGSGMIVVSGQYLNQVAGVRSETCRMIYCVAAPLVSFGGYTLLLLGGMEMLFGFLIRGGYIPAKRQKFSLEPGSGPDSERILRIANESLAMFKFRKIGLGPLPWFWEVGTLAWQDGLPWYWCRFKHRKLLAPPEQFLLSASLQGRLESEDWRVLFSYCLLSRKPPFHVLVGLVVWLLGALLIIVIVLLGEVYGIQAGSPYAQAISLPLFVLWLASALPLAKSSFLRKDKVAASRLGGTVLLELFKKIDRLELGDVENGKRRKGLVAFFWPMPNITERIANLESVGSHVF